MHVLWENWQALAWGFGRTLALTVLSYALALGVGTIMAIFRVSPVHILRAVGTCYVEFFRNIPLLTLMVLVVFGLPDAGVRLGLFASAVLAICLSSGAFVCETIRSGINTVGVGQSEAARSLGLNMVQQLRYVILPQAFMAMISPLVNVFIGTLIGTSLASAVGVAELTNVTQQLNVKYAEAVILFLVSGVIYVAVALGGSKFGTYLQRKVGSPGLSKGSRQVMLEGGGPQ
ncbi:MAG: amino acid ABC transporter permease [Actinomycetaceae bacterium]|nr:amino acid ABC transporter permease [Actinomycetaceae bacterium]